MIVQTLTEWFNYLHDKQFRRYLLVGVLNTVFGYSIFAFFIYCGLHYVVAGFLSTCLAVIFNFKTTGTMVFRQANNALFLRFITVYTILFFVNICLLKLGTYFIMNIYLNGAIVILLMAIAAYLLNKRFVFQRISHETD